MTGVRQPLPMRFRTLSTPSTGGQDGDADHARRWSGDPPRCSVTVRVDEFEVSGQVVVEEASDGADSVIGQGEDEEAGRRSPPPRR